MPKAVEETKDKPQAFDDLKAFVQGNPRELKPLVNVHRLTKILLQRTRRITHDWPQRKLVEWLIFCARWPDLVYDVRGCARDEAAAPDAIRRLIDTCDVGGEANRG